MQVEVDAFHCDQNSKRETGNDERREFRGKRCRDTECDGGIAGRKTSPTFIFRNLHLGRIKIIARMNVQYWFSHQYNQIGNNQTKQHQFAGA